MKIPVSLQIPSSAGRVDTQGLLQLMKPGMVFQARVLESPAAGVARLLIGNTTLNATTRVPLQQGEALALRVSKGLPEPELKVLGQLTQPRNLAHEVLRNAMPRQMPPREVLQLVRLLAQSLPQAATAAASAGGGKALPMPGAPAPGASTAQLAPQPSPAGPVAPRAAEQAAPQQVLRVLVPNATPPQALNAATVKTALDQSGLFFEANLLQGKLQPGDRKLELLKLLRLFTLEARSAGGSEAPQEARAPAADQLMNRLLRLVEGSLARIQTHQAASMPGEDPARQVWQFELPLQLVDRQDHLQLRVQRDGQREDAEGEMRGIWKVDIEFAFDNLGGIFSRINLSGDEISAAFWCDRDDTARQIEAAIPRLEKALQDAGLSVTAISALTGEPPRPTPPSDSLLDERA